jgi:hypothetical protein
MNIKYYILKSGQQYVGKELEDGLIEDVVVCLAFPAIDQNNGGMYFQTLFVPIGAPLNKKVLTLNKENLDLIHEDLIDPDYVERYNKTIDTIKEKETGIVIPKVKTKGIIY